MAGLKTDGPNLFELTFEDTNIVYERGGADGVSRLRYDGPLGAHVFEGEEIQTFRSARGLEVRVTLDRSSHLRTITLTVFVPDLEFEDATSELTFRTVGIHATQRRGSISRSGEIVSEPLQFEGRARAVGAGEPAPA